jgi:hypothetical protein
VGIYASRQEIEIVAQTDLVVNFEGRKEEMRKYRLPQDGRKTPL